jgi:transposase
MGLEWWPYPLPCEICGCGRTDPCGSAAPGFGADAGGRAVRAGDQAAGGGTALARSRKSAYPWQQLWREGGVQALASRGPSGSRCRLSPRRLEKFARYLEQGPAAHGWVEDQVWTAARVATLIGRKFHAPYSASGATRLMHRLGFSLQVPARRVAERDERAVTVSNWPKPYRKLPPRASAADPDAPVIDEVSQADLTRCASSGTPSPGSPPIDGSPVGWRRQSQPGSCPQLPGTVRTRP